MVILYGGINDFTHSQTQTQAGTNLASWIKKACSYFPNSKITVCYGNAGRMFLETYSAYSEWLSSVYITAQNYGLSKYVSFINPCNWHKFYPGTEDTDTGYFKSDNLHPNASGDYVIASYMQAILEGTYSFSNKTRLITLDECPLVAYPDGVETVYGKLNEVRFICEYTDALNPKIYLYAKTVEMEDTAVSGNRYYLQPSAISEVSEKFNWGFTGFATSQRVFPLVILGKFTGCIYRYSVNSATPENRVQFFLKYNTELDSLSNALYAYM